MNLNKNVIQDLLQLYAANECSADTRTLVEEYFREHPDEAAEFRRIMNAPLPRATATGAARDETQAFRETRKRLRRRQWLMALAVFFSLAPFLFVFADNISWWMLRDAPKTAAVYGTLGVALWIIYGVQRRRARSL